MKQIEVVVRRNGQTELLTKGYDGEACLAASRFLEVVLGRVVRDCVTSEYHDIRGRARARQQDKLN